MEILIVFIPIILFLIVIIAIIFVSVHGVKKYVKQKVKETERFQEFAKQKNMEYEEMNPISFKSFDIDQSNWQLLKDITGKYFKYYQQIKGKNYLENIDILGNTSGFLEFQILKIHRGILSHMLKSRIENKYQYSLAHYSWSSGGKNKTTHHRWVGFFNMGNRILPDFYMRPENFADKVGGLVGIQDIDFSQYPDFSKKYMLKGNDERLIRVLFTPDLLSFLEKSSSWVIQGKGTCISAYKEDIRDVPIKISNALLIEYLDELRNLFRNFI